MMTENDLLKITEQTKMQRRSILFARGVLVDGLTVSEVAKKYNVTRQTVSSAKNRVLRHKEKADGVPSDWLSVYSRLPPDLAHAVTWIYDYERYKAGATVTKPEAPPKLERPAIETLMELLKQQ